MHARQLSHILSPLSPTITHQYRRAALFEVTSALLSGGQLGVTNLGRNLPGKAYVKHKIKKVDRLVGNKHLQTECLAVYRAKANILLSNRGRAKILVDWSPCGRRAYQVLRASLVDEGRSLTLYQEVHQEKDMHKQLVEF